MKRESPLRWKWIRCEKCGTRRQIWEMSESCRFSCCNQEMINDPKGYYGIGEPDMHDKILGLF